MKASILGVVALAAILTVPVHADAPAKAKKIGKSDKGSVATQILKQLEPVNLTDDQIEKIKELGQAADSQMNMILDEAGITKEVIKKRMEARKSMREQGKKGKELVSATNEAAGLSEAQVAGLQKVEDARAAFRKQVVATLTDEQKSQLPKALQRVSDSKEKSKGKGKGKKKQEA